MKWTFLADYGRFITLNLCAYFVLACKQQFLSPQKTFSKDQGITGSFDITEDYARFLINDSPVLTIPYDPVNELSYSRAILSKFADSHSASFNLCVTEASDQIFQRPRRSSCAGTSVLDILVPYQSNGYYVSLLLVHLLFCALPLIVHLLSALHVNMAKPTANCQRSHFNPIA